MSEAVQSWLGKSLKRPDGSVVQIPTLYAALEVGVERRLAKDARVLVAGGSDVLVVCDQRTAVYAEPVERALRDQGFQIHRYTAPDEADGSPPSPTEEAALLVAEKLQELGIALAVSVGSGTINDRTKHAAAQAGIPYLSYATAASMNGYNSPIVALYVKGLKSTVPSTPPLGLYADPEVIAKAPRSMHLAGLGDLCSKPFANADSIIAAILSEKPAWTLPSQMVEEVFEQTLQNAEAIGQDDPEAMAQLMEALWVSGFSMVLAGTSAPASGGEHLWSHRIDMAQHDAGLPARALHGTQVGIACELVRPLFARAAAADPEALLTALKNPPPAPTDDDFDAWIENRHAELKPASRAAIRKQAANKYDHTYRTSLHQGLRRHWTRIQQELQGAAEHATRITLALSRAGAPQTPQEIGLRQQDSDRILKVCRDIRNRLTILDLHAELFGD